MLVPALEPEFTSPVVKEHATCAEAMSNLDHYLEDVCGFAKNQRGHAVPAPGKQKAAFDARIKYVIEELCGLYVHLRKCLRAKPPHPPPN